MAKVFQTEGIAEVVAETKQTNKKKPLRQKRRKKEKKRKVRSLAHSRSTMEAIGTGMQG